MPKIFQFCSKSQRNWESQFRLFPGIKPIAVQRHLQVLPQIFRIDLPEDLIHAVDKCKNNAEIKQVGIEWAIQQSSRIKSSRSSGFALLFNGKIREYSPDRESSFLRVFTYFRQYCHSEERRNLT
jgi:5,10-methylenetetrahydrofolate reductase